MKHFAARTLALAILMAAGSAWAGSADHENWAQTDAQLPPVQDVRGSGYWWWPSDAKSNVDDGESWGNQGQVFGAFSPPPPPPPRELWPVGEPSEETFEPIALSEEPAVDIFSDPRFEPELEPDPVFEEPAVDIFSDERFAREPEAEEMQMARVPEPLEEEPTPVISEPEPEQPGVDIFGDQRFLPGPEEVQIARATEPLEEEPWPVIPEPEPEQPGVDIFGDPRFLPESEEIQTARATEPIEEEPWPIIPVLEPEQPAINIFGDERFAPVEEEPTLVAEALEEAPPESTRSVPIFQNVLFDFDKSNLRPEGQELVKKVVRILDEYAHDTLIIEGHTDNVNRSGDPEYNEKLGLRRADSVLNALVEDGTHSERVESESKSDREPAVSNETEEGRALNRRVVFKYTISD